MDGHCLQTMTSYCSPHSNCLEGSKTAAFQKEKLLSYLIVVKEKIKQIKIKRTLNVDDGTSMEAKLKKLCVKAFLQGLSCYYEVSKF